MLKYNFLAIVLVLFGIGCEEHSSMNYDDDVLVKVLKDMLIAEGAASRVSIDQRDSLNNFYYGQIYQIHQIDSLKFAEDLVSLGENPEHSISIYSRVEKELEKEQVTAKEKKSKKK